MELLSTLQQPKFLSKETTPSGLTAIENRIVVKVDLRGKSFHTFSNGHKIILERDFDNFDKKYTQITQGEVISGGYVPQTSIILFHHNASHPVNQIFNLRQMSGADIASDIKHFSIPESMCFAYHDGTDWTPMKGYEFALRVFEPVKTKFYGIAPRLIKDTLYIQTGEYARKVVHTLRACDYEIIFNDFNGQEKRIIRCRHFPGQRNDREEIIAVNHHLTKGVLEESVFIGLTPLNARANGNN